MDGGLEVDARNDLHIAYPKHGDVHKYYIGEEQLHQPSYRPYPPEPDSRTRRFYGLRLITLILSIALAVFVVLAGVAAGVAGSLAAKRGGTRGIVQSNSSSSSPASNASTLPTYLYHINDSPFQPTSNCTSLGIIYTSRFTSANFKLQCGLDLPGNDFYSVFVYYFTDCIEACAAVARYPGLNQTCYGVAFDTNYDLTPSGRYGNCFLKNSPDIRATVANINFTSSAVLVGG